MKVEEVRRQSDICKNYYLFNIQLYVCKTKHRSVSISLIMIMLNTIPSMMKYYASESAATPGSTLPSSSSRLAPPPVLT